LVVGIFGCGPAGLFAAQAVQDMGHQPVIISKKIKSKIYGAQFLHKPIPGLVNPKPQGYIKTYRLGTAAGYAERVYGNGTELTSWDRVPVDPVKAWDLREAYDRAWEKFEGQISLRSACLDSPALGYL
jgi:hypothetical protein